MISALLQQGEEIDSADLRPAVARFLPAIASCPFTSLTRVLRHGEVEGLVVEFCLSLPQRPAYPLNAKERVVLAWEASGETAYPSVHPARSDFPSTPHRNIVSRDELPSLCLFDRSILEYASELTPQRFLKRVERWFDRAGMGTLHQLSQRMEPFVLGAEQLICQEALFDPGTEKQLVLVLPRESGGRTTYFALATDRKDADTVRLCKHVPLLLSGKPTSGLIVHRYPRHFADLAAMLKAAGIDLYAEVREASHQIEHQPLFEKEWVFVLRLPKVRANQTEDTEHLAFFLSGITIGDLGVKLNHLLQDDETKRYLRVHLLGGQDSDEDELGQPRALNPVFSLTPARARELAGVDDQPWAEWPLVAVGAGALGSQAILNLARQGTGVWTIADHDTLLPHNLSRHGLGFSKLGLNKAMALVEAVGAILDNSDSRALMGNVLVPGSTDLLEQRVSEAQGLLDLTASRPVLRRLAAIKVRPPALSAYLTQRGRYLVILAEGTEQEARLDDLDIELAAACAFESDLSETFHRQEGTVRYGGACSDLAVAMPQSMVAVHAGILSLRIKEWLQERRDPEVTRWEILENTTVTRIDLAVSKPLVLQPGDGWQLRISAHALEQMRAQRQENLPRETCGVLVGAFDFSRQITYVARALPAPPDSKLSHAGCRRGFRGLRDSLDEIRNRSGETLDYVGEWHSHPKGSRGNPSKTDRRALQDLHSVLAEEGVPALVLIQGEPRKPGVLFAC